MVQLWPGTRVRHGGEEHTILYHVREYSESPSYVVTEEGKMLWHRDVEVLGEDTAGEGETYVDEPRAAQ